MWLTDDGGESWRKGNEGLRPRYLPDDVPEEERRHCCVHRLRRTPRSGRSGSSCSSTAASTAPTTPARAGATSRTGLPSDFGFPLAIDPADPDSAYVIPLVADIGPRDARGAGARVRDARRRRELDAARRRAARAGHAYLTILREAFERTGEGGALSFYFGSTSGAVLLEPNTALELYFGSTSGAVFGSGDAGESWFEAAANLPPVYSVAAT